MHTETLKKPTFPYFWFGPVLGFSTPLIFGLIPEGLRYGFPLKYILIIVVFSLVTIFFIYVFIELVKKYKREKALVERCTQKGIATTIETGLCSNNVGDRNPTFVTAEFNGHERDFIDIDPKIRRTLSKNDYLDIFFNPKDRSEFVPICFKKTGDDHKN